MMQRFRNFILIFLISFINDADAKSSKKPPYEDSLIQLTQTFAKQMKNELNLEYSGKGFDIHDKVEEIRMKFRANRRATLEEARTLQVLVMNKLVQAINEHKKIQPYLSTSPFTFKGVKISINFDGPYASYFKGNITHIFNVADSGSIVENKNNFFYYGKDPITEESILLLQESYEEASNLALATPIKTPHLHQTTELEILSDQIFLKFGKELGEKNALYLITAGANLTNGIEEIAAKFIYFTPSTIDTARKLALLAIEKTLSAVNHDQKLKSYLKPYPFSASQLKIRIEFRKNDKSAWGYSSFTDGSMDKVEITNDLFSYFRTPPVKKGIEDVEINFLDPLFATETYQEALDAARKLPSPQKKNSW